MLRLTAIPGNTKGGRINVLLTSCLTGLESVVWQLTIFVFICETDKFKPVKQEVNSTVILPPLVFPGYTYYRYWQISDTGKCTLSIIMILGISHILITISQVACTSHNYFYLFVSYMYYAIDQTYLDNKPGIWPNYKIQDISVALVNIYITLKHYWFLI